MYTTNKQLPALLKQMHNVKGADPEISERGGGGGWGWTGKIVCGT